MLHYMKNIFNIQKLKLFSLSFTFSVFFIMFFRLFSNEVLNFSRDLGYVASFSVLYAGLMCLWNNNLRHKRLCLLFVGLYLLSALLKRCSDMILSEREITHTIGLAIILFSVVSFIYYTALSFTQTYLKNSLKIIALILCVIFILPALLFLGYAAVNRGFFSADIMLTLFQTNSEEVIAYLQDRNLWHWGIGIVVIVSFVVFYVCYAVNLKKEGFSVVNYFFVLVWIVYTLYAIMPKLNLCSLVNIIETTRATLHSFDEFKENKILRTLRLRNLMKLASDNEQNGVYVLVIGESENKDHMQLYGYKRKNTPWLAELALNKNTVVFENAYSNHTHTTPTLTYALSGQNQYDNVELDEAFSLIEAAQAVGYKTYWISNQSKYELWETPITTMASAADVQHWLNVNSGDKLFTSYYDEKLVEKIPSYQTDEKMLIVVHVMGCHGAYRDRYPAKYRHFYGKDKNIDAYDNSVLYNDYVLQQIYNKVRDYPDFKAFVYFSDHGEDVDKALGHESSRFTYSMARIPLIINVSEKFVEENKEKTIDMIKNKDAYWTNDLIYNLMTSLMDIKGLPNTKAKYDLLSSSYDMPKSEIKLLHGQKDLKQEN